MARTRASSSGAARFQKIEAPSRSTKARTMRVKGDCRRNLAMCGFDQSHEGKSRVDQGLSNQVRPRPRIPMLDSGAIRVLLEMAMRWVEIWTFSIFDLESELEVEFGRSDSQ